MNRGRGASTPTDIPAKGWMDVAWRVKDEISQDRIGLIAAGIAFYGLLALFPAITAIVAIVAIGGLVAEPQQITSQIQALEGLLPQEVTTIITDQATEVMGSWEGGLGFAALLGLGIALYSASKGTSSLMEGMNAVYDKEESRGLLAKTTTRLGLTLLVILGICLGLSITILIPALTSYLEAGQMTETLGTIAAYLLLFVLGNIGLAVIYRDAPARDNAEFAWLSPGALASTAWVVASAGFAFYVGNFGTYNETFGTLGGAIVLLMWFWISAFIVLFGAELNSEAEAQTRHDTAVGDTAPMGQRNAVKAGGSNGVSRSPRLSFGTMLRYCRLGVLAISTCSRISSRNSRQARPSETSHCPTPILSAISEWVISCRLSASSPIDISSSKPLRSRRIVFS